MNCECERSGVRKQSGSLSWRICAVQCEPASAKAGRRASVLVLALWTLFFLGALAVAVGSAVSMSLRTAERLRGDLLAWTLAKSGVALAMAEVAKDTNEWDTLAEPWADNESLFKDVPCEGGHYRVSWEDRSDLNSPRLRYGVRDEDGKINLRLADTNLMCCFFMEAGDMSESSAAILANAVVRYRERAPSLLTGLGGTTYSSRDKPPLERLQSLYELRQVEGITPELFARIAPYCTVFGGDQASRKATVNIYTADPLVLRAFMRACGVSEPDGLIRLILEFRKSLRDKALAGNSMDALWSQFKVNDDPVLKSAFMRLKGRLPQRSTCFGGVAEGWVETGTVARISFVFDRKSGALRSWREE